jgi:peroxiredoxin
MNMPGGQNIAQRKLRRGLFSFLFIAIFSSNLAHAQRAIDFTLKDLDGNPVRLSDFRGKSVVLIDFWATWCVPCVKELTHFQRFYEAYKEKGLVIFAITVDGPETVSLVKPFLRRYKYTFPVLLDTESRVLALYNPRVVLPYTLIIDREGDIQYAHQGYSPGDEKVLEEEIQELLEPRRKGREHKYSFQGNEAFLSRNFEDKDYVERVREGRESQVINQLDLTVSRGDYLAGVRLDADLDFSPWKDKYSLAKRFFEINRRGFSLRAGDYYYTVGRGLAFSVLKTFEKEGLEYLIDTTIDGGKLSFSQGLFSAEIFGGWLDREQSDLKDKIYGGTAGLHFKNFGDLRFNFVGSRLERGSSYGNRDVSQETVSLDIPNLKDRAKFYGEFLLVQKKKYYREDRITGHGVYLETGLFGKNWSFLFELKDYKNMDFEYNRPPLLESEQIPVVANQFATSAIDITGISGRVDCALPRANSVFYGKASYQKDNPGKYSRTISHVFVGVEKRFKATGWWNSLAGIREERASSLVFYYTAGRTYHYQSNISYPLTGRLSLELDIEGKDFRGRLSFGGKFNNYYERRSYLSLHYSPRWVATLFFDQTNDPEILFLKDKRDWWGGQLEFRFSQANSLRIFYGSNKGGVKCAGGVCKFFPPFEGLRVDFLLRF